MGSRIREHPTHLIECFCEVVAPQSNGDLPWIVHKFPDSFKEEEILKPIPQFAFPCDISNERVQHFSFVLTSGDSKWTFGFCRLAPHAETALLVISYIPWHEFFYKILNQIAELMQNSPEDVPSFLESLYKHHVPEPSNTLRLTFGSVPRIFTSTCPNTYKLPSLPEDRNLGEYWTAVDPHNMMFVFASMLQERRIIMKSTRLSRLSACVQTANSLIYPMSWQHIYIPVMPRHLLDYLSAPMPFLIGVPTSTFERVRRSELGDCVILDLDTNQLEAPSNDLELLPPEIVSQMKAKFRSQSTTTGDGIARVFLRALVHLIGGYRDALKFRPGEQISFDEHAFVVSRSAAVQPFLRNMLQLQTFRQFIEERLYALNSGEGFTNEFEKEVFLFADRTNGRIGQQYKEWLSNFRKESGALLKKVKETANPAMKNAVSSMKQQTKAAKEKSKSAFRPKTSFSELPGLKGTDSCVKYVRPSVVEKPRSAPSSPKPEPKSSTMPSAPYDIRRCNTQVNGNVMEKSLSPESEDDLGMAPLNLDLMGDMQDFFFQQASFAMTPSSPPERTKTPPVIDRSLKPSLSADSPQSPLLGSPSSVLSSPSPTPNPVPTPGWVPRSSFLHQTAMPSLASPAISHVPTRPTLARSHTTLGGASTGAGSFLHSVANPAHAVRSLPLPLPPPRCRRRPDVNTSNPAKDASPDLIRLDSLAITADEEFDPLSRTNSNTNQPASPVMSNPLYPLHEPLVRESATQRESAAVTSPSRMTVQSNGSTASGSAFATPPSKRLRMSKLSLKGRKQLTLLQLELQTSQKLGIESSVVGTNPKEETMHSMRPSVFDPMGAMSHHMGFSASSMSSGYVGSRLDINGEPEQIEKEKSILGFSLMSKDSDKNSSPVASLLNLGNTCFLNTILYTLRFTPGFPHLLHHLAGDITDKKMGSSATSTLERRQGALGGSPGVRTKSLSSLVPQKDHSSDENGMAIDASQRKIMVLTERLHELFQMLHHAEHKGDLSDPFPSDAFLEALRDVNPLFQGNQQQDAHELLVCVLDYLREACQIVDKCEPPSSPIVASTETPTAGDSSASSVPLELPIPDTLKKGKNMVDKKKKGRKMFSSSKGEEILPAPLPLAAEQKRGVKKLSRDLPPSPTNGVNGTEVNYASKVKPSRDFITENFEGVTVLRTTCLECEFVTERKEAFTDICVPITTEQSMEGENCSSASALYASALMAQEFLQGTNKYWCEQCLRYNEARRSVHYEKLPKLLVLQLKRFSFSYGSSNMSKVNDYMPTPLTLDCFCEHCQDQDNPQHLYRLYAVIMHLGATMASGHYVAYTRAYPPEAYTAQATLDYVGCPRAKNVINVQKPSQEKSGGLFKFFKPRPSHSTLLTMPSNNEAFLHKNAGTICRALNCCSVRPRKLNAAMYETSTVNRNQAEGEASNGSNPGNNGRDSPATIWYSLSDGNEPWLECDDEIIKVLKARELEEMLGPKPGKSAAHLTPYLLFYVQVGK